MGYVRLINYWDFFSNQDDKDIVFSGTDDIEVRKSVFNKYVYIIHLELSTFCNRKCSYCPMSFYPRKQEFMKDELFEKIIDELADIGYQNSISLNLYNEPLYDDDLEKKIQRIKEKLPLSYIHFNSNGDLLTGARLESLFKAGMSQIRVTLHTNPDDEWSDEKKRMEFRRFLEKIGKEEYYDKRSETTGKSIMVEIPFSNNRRVIIQCMNWGVYGSDRGGELVELSGEKRIVPCIYPIREFCIAYDGSVRYCCHIYFNSPDCGNLNDKGILDHYFGKKLIQFRKTLYQFGEKSGGCSNCNSGIEFVPTAGTNSI